MIRGKYGINPYEIIAALRLELLEKHFNKILGCYTFFSPRKRGIIINARLEGYLLIFTLFHEIAHCLLGHQGKIYKSYGYISRNREERDADLLATFFFLDFFGLDLDRPETFEGIVLPEKIRFFVEYIRNNR